MNVHLADLPGIDVVRKWRQDNYRPSVILTGVGITAEHVIAAKHTGIETILARPFTADQLEYAIRDTFPSPHRLGRRYDLRATLKERLRRVDFDERMAALRLARGDPHPDLLPELTRCLIDPSARVRLAAAELLEPAAHPAYLLQSLTVALRCATSEEIERTLDLVLSHAPGPLIAALEAALGSTDLITRSTGKALMERIHSAGLDTALQTAWKHHEWANRPTEGTQ